MEALDYLKKIEDAGYTAYIVGGYVRDTLLGRASTDVDITTSASPKEIANIFGLNLNDKLGCVNIKTSTLNIDITTFRSEAHYLGHTPKKVTYVSDLKTDLKRRDFTINTICMDKTGKIIDLLDGQKDLENRELRVVGKVKRKFREDPLRMLRALRFSIIYDLKIGEEELMFILNNKALFKEISYERRKEELDKILISEYSIKGLEFLKNLNILEILEIDYPANLIYVRDIVGMWSQLSFTDKFPFTKVEKQRIQNIRRIVEDAKINNETIFNYGLYDTLIGAEILGIEKESINEMYADMKIHSKEELSINGSDIKSILDLESGPKIKEIKKDLICNLLSGNLTNDKESLTEYIKKKWK